ncbi:hypothetical protein M378DRAFT_163777, partial [Amanita muscaria Koide BX008]
MDCNLWIMISPYSCLCIDRSPSVGQLQPLQPSTRSVEHSTPSRGTMTLCPHLCKITS